MAKKSDKKGIPQTQPIDIIECPDSMVDKLLYRFPQTSLASVKIGTELIVHEKQVAILCLDGKFLDVFPTGKHILYATSMPLLSALKTLEENHPFQLAIYFISTYEFSLPWGTPQPIPAGNSHSDIMLLQGFGDFSFFVSSPLEFVEHNSGVSIYSLEEMHDSFRNKILSALTKTIGSLSNKDKLSALEILSQTKIIEKTVRNTIRKDVKKIGVDFKRFQISNIKPYEKSQEESSQPVKFADSNNKQEMKDTKSRKLILKRVDASVEQEYINTNIKNFSTPIIWHDQPIGENGVVQFNYDGFATTIARLISSKKTETPLSICVSGVWGAGKTTLLKRVKAMLDKTPVLDKLTEPAILEFVNDDEYPQKDFRTCKTVWFNAWKYSGDGELLAALFRTILQTMANDNLVNKLLSRMMNRLHPRRNVVKTVLSWFKVSAYGVDVKLDTGQETQSRLSEKIALLDLFDEAFDALVAAWVHRTLKSKKINPQKGVLVIFIDDLDRCLPDKMIQVFETMKLFLDKTGCIFVIGADIALIQQAIVKHYADAHVTGDNAKDYLDKIIQLRFELPPIQDLIMEEYLKNEKLIDDDWGNSWRLLITGANVNPRAVKAYINDVNFQWSMLVNTKQADGVNRDDFYAWQVLMRIAPRNFLYKLKVVFFHPDDRLKFVLDAIRWANTPDYLKDIFAEYEDDVRFRRVLQNIQFSEDFTPNVLEAFVHLTSPLSFELLSTDKETPEISSIVSRENQLKRQDFSSVEREKSKLKVYLSHSAVDKPMVRELYRKLTDDEVDVWLDEENLLPGQDWNEAIMRAISSSDCVIICLSSASVNRSGFMQKELGRIVDIAAEVPKGEIYVIPVRFDDCEIPEQLRQFQFVDLFRFDENKKDNGYRKILRALNVRAYSLNRHFKNLD